MMNKIIRIILVLAVAISSSTVDAGACERGLRAGRKAVKKMWKNLDKNCDEIWGLETSARRMTDRRFRARGSNWRKAAFNRCARNGVDKAIEKFEEKCLEKTADQCKDLADVAAEM